MSVRTRSRHPHVALFDDRAGAVGAAYDRAGDDYLTYADGDAADLFSFKGPHAYADRRVWSALAKELSDLRATGATSVRILDAGCGPGTWLQRLVWSAQSLGFAKVAARGFDVSKVQVESARQRTECFCRLPDVDVRFDVADLRDPLPEIDNSVDITVCLYSVLSHLPTDSLPGVARELARVSRGAFVTTVRAIGSPPTAFVDSMEKVRALQLDHEAERCDVELASGLRVTVPAHLFDARELRRLFHRDFDIEELSGLDIFHSRFAPDGRWNKAQALADRGLANRLAKLEQQYARSPSFIDRATHLLLVGRRRAIRDPRSERE